MDLSKEIKVLKKELSDSSKIAKEFKNESGYKKEVLYLENKINYFERLQRDYSNAGYFKRKFLEFEYEHLNVFSIIFYLLNFTLIYGVIKLISQLN